MKLRKMVLGFLLTMALVVFSSMPAMAISPQQECEDAGGVYSKTGGTQTCTFSETPGNNQGGVTKTEEDSQKGSSRSSHPEEETNSVDNDGGTHFPPGQN